MAEVPREGAPIDAAAAAGVHYVDPRVRRLAEARWRLTAGGSHAKWLALGKGNPEALIWEGRDWLRAAVAGGLLPPYRDPHEAPGGGLTPAPQVRATRYEVSLLPEDDINYRLFRVLVEERDGYGWTVHDGHACLSAAGVWDGVGVSVYGNDEAWIAAHRFDLDTALRLAREAAPGVTVNGVTAAEALRRRQAA